jgi:L-fuculose-phosphate aldolase
MSYNLITLKNQLVEVGRRMYDRGYVASNDGNISAKVDDERVVITPTGVSKGYITPDMMVVVDMEGKVLNGDKKASSEVFMHIQVYKDRPDVGSVCHSHPPYATGYAVAGIPLDKCVLPEVVIALGNIPLVAYGTPGTDEFYKPVVPLLQDYDAFLLANHGALTVGKDILNAYHKMETLEHFAHITYVAQQVGNLNVLNKDQVKKLTDQREKYGIRTNVGCISCEDDNSCSIDAKQNSNNDKIDFQNLSEHGRQALINEITDAILKKLR